MLQQSLAVAFFLASALAIPSPIKPDPNGDKNLGNGQGLQFITGACASTADCNQNVVSSCCAFIAGGGATTGICSGTAVANTNGKAGCGFGDPPGEPVAGANAGAGTEIAMNGASPLMVVPLPDESQQSQGAAGSAACTVNTALAGSQNVGLGTQAQFITGQCFSAADCASGCCVAQAAGVSLCKAQLVTNQAGGSCDFSCA